jgi:anti-anti-sigma factor
VQRQLWGESELISRQVDSGTGGIQLVYCFPTLIARFDQTVAELTDDLAAKARQNNERDQRLKSPGSTSTSHLEITVDRDGMDAIVRLKGRVDVDSSPDVRDCLLAILTGEQLLHAVTVDLDSVTSIEASGIATLVEALKIAGHRQIGLHLQGLHGSVSRMFEVTGLLPLFETTPGGKGVS